MLYSKYIEDIISNPKYFPWIGFVVVRNALAPGKVCSLRNILHNSFAKYSVNCKQRLLSPTVAQALPEVRELIFLDKIVSCLQNILGKPYVNWGDFQVQKNMFGPWHRDCDSERPARYLYEKRYKFVKCGVFLQENTNDFGGGINIQWLGHKFLFDHAPLPVRLSLKVITDVILRRMLSHKIRINAGDFVAFDSRLPHFSSLPKGVTLKSLGSNTLIENLSEPNAKYVCYWNACALNQEENFAQHSINRCFKEESSAILKSANANNNAESIETFFCEYLAKYFPEDFEDDFIAKLKQHDIKFASLSREQANVFKQLCNLKRSKEPNRVVA